MRLNAWRSTLLCLFALFMSPLASFSADKGPVLEYSGAYSRDLVWEKSVTMSGDVLILAGASLTVRAGTQVNVVPAEGTKIDPEYLSALTELLVRGRLDIQGTVDAPVRFVIADANETAEVAWSGITLDRATGSRIHYAELERADIAVRCVASSPEIEGNRISNCRYGIVAQQESHPRVLRNVIDGGEGGLFCWRGSNPYLLDNTITNHDEEAVFVDASSRPRLDRNIISGNAIGLALYPRDLAFEAVEVVDNSENVRWLGQQGQVGVK